MLMTMMMTMMMTMQMMMIMMINYANCDDRGDNDDDYSKYHNDDDKDIDEQGQWKVLGRGGEQRALLKPTEWAGKT